MQLAIMMVCTFIIAYAFNIGFFPAAIGGVIVGTIIIWAVVQAFFGGGQQPGAAEMPQPPDAKKK